MGSGIIFNNGGGGGGQNPTASYIPLNNGTSNFIDSDIVNNKSNLIYTLLFGLSIDFNNHVCFFGDYDNNYEGTRIALDDNNRYIYFITNPITFLIDGVNNVSKFNYSGNDVGLQLDFVSHIYSFADFNNIGNGTALIINDAIELIKTKHQGNDIGLKIDFSNDIYSIGDFNNLNNGSYIQIDDANRFIYSQCYGNDLGLKLDFQNYKYYLGDYNGIQQNTHIRVDDDNTLIFMKTDYIELSGTQLLSNNANGNSGQHLKITINGTQYKLALLNP